MLRILAAAPPACLFRDRWNPMSTEPQPKPRKRSPSKTASRQDDQKVKITLYLAADLAKRFAVHATYTDMDRSELFAEMVKEHCGERPLEGSRRGE